MKGHERSYLGCKVWRSGLRVQGLGFRVRGLEVRGLRFGVYSGFRD